MNSGFRGFKVASQHNDALRLKKSLCFKMQWKFRMPNVSHTDSTCVHGTRGTKLQRCVLEWGLLPAYGLWVSGIPATDEHVVFFV